MDDQRIEKQRIISHSVDVYVTLIVISLLGYYSLQLLAPFVSVLLWAAILAVALHPLFMMLRGAVGGGTGRSATIIAIVGLVVLIIPAFLVADSIIDSLGIWSGQLRNEGLTVPPPPEAVKGWPIIGEKLHALWAGAHADLERTIQHFAPQLEKVAVSMLSAAGGLAIGVLQFAMSIIFAAVFLSFAEPLKNGMTILANRVSTDRGRTFLEMAGATIRNVSRGIIGVAIIQGGLASIGMLAVGLPFAGFLAALTVAACIVQVPMLVIVPTIIYVWSAETTMVATIYTVFMVPVLISDNFLKPMLMARGLETPMVVILVGVIGGTITSGLMGLFVGPVVLALFYKMVLNWVGGSQGGTDGEDAKSGDAKTPA